METLDLIFKAITLAIVSFSAVTAYRTLKKFHEWNRRKSTQEILKDLVLGDYPKFSKILSENNIKPFDKKRFYAKDISTLDDIDIKNNVIYATRNIANLFEFIAINIKNNTIDDEICYDYLGFMYIEFFRWSEEYISEMRKESNDNRIFNNFEEKAVEWKQRFDMEIVPKKVPGRPKL